MRKRAIIVVRALANNLFVRYAGRKKVGEGIFVPSIVAEAAGESTKERLAEIIIAQLEEKATQKKEELIYSYNFRSGEKNLLTESMSDDLVEAISKLEPLCSDEAYIFPVPTLLKLKLNSEGKYEVEEVSDWII